jgi:hypothetical protein
MGVSFFLLGVLAMVGGIIAYAAKRQRRWAWNVAAVAGEHDLMVIGGNALSPTVAEGSIDGLGTVIDTYTVKAGKSSQTYSRIRINLNLHSDLTIHEEGPGSSFTKFFAGDDVETNIRAFDDLVYMKGPESVLIAALDYEAREAIRDAIVDGVSVKEGCAYIRVRNMIQDEAELRTHFDNVLALARAMTRNKRSIRAGLAYNAQHDPDREFRLRCFKRLVEAYRISDETRDTARVMLNSERPIDRVHAAKHLGMAEAGSLRAITLDRSIESATRVDALQAFHTIMAASPQVDALLIELCSMAAPSVDDLTMAILTLAGERKTGLPYEVLAGYLAQAPADLGDDASVAEKCALARALEFCDDDRVEGHLLRLLSDEADPVATVAASALGTVSKVNVVPALVQRSDGFFTSSDLKRAAREAIALIQGRVGREMGQSISFSDQANADGLSIAEQDS